MARVFVITGPSGVGKGTLIEQLRRRVPDLELSVSATTRRPRPGEQDGVAYHFLSDDQFQSRIDRGDFLEWATYSGNRYGTLRSEVDARLAAGRSVVLEIEVDGARQIRASMPEAIRVFIAPPRPQALEQRLRDRGTDSEAAIKARLKVAREELAAQGEFAHVIVNGEFDLAVQQLTETIESALAR